MAGVAHARNLMSVALRGAYRMRVSGIESVPPRGPVLLACNHPGILDGAVLLGMSPRPVHVVSDVAGWPGVVGRATSTIGQVHVTADDGGRTALREALALLAAGEAVALMPEGAVCRGDASVIHAGIAYLATRTAAAVVPVCVLGSRGRAALDPPRPRSLVEVRYGVALDLPRVADPYSRRDLATLTEAIRQGLADHVTASVARSSIDLPKEAA